METETNIRTPWQPTVAVILLALLLAINAYQALTAPTATTKFEYKIESIPDANFANAMNLLGIQGWEAVSARRASDGASTNPTFSYEIIFRRTLPSRSAPLIPIKTP